MVRSNAASPALGLSVAVALLLGALIAMSLPRVPGIGILVGLFVLGLWQWLRPVHRFARWSGALLFGLALAGLHAQSALDRRLPEALEGADLTMLVRVVGLPQARSDSIRFDVRVLAGQGDAAELDGRRLRLSWYGAAPKLTPGQNWRLTVRLRRPRGSLNPGGFDFERWAMQRRIAATGYVRAPLPVEPLAATGGLDAWRQAMAERIDAGLVQRDSRFVRGLALGDTRALSDRDWLVLRATGLSHLLAISGFHVGVVAGFGALLGRLLWWLWPGLGLRLPRPLGGSLLALLAALAYAAAAGFALPTLRATLMIGTVLLARLLARTQQPSQAFALALLAIVLADPLAVLGAGFWLSFLGVGWLLWCLPSQGRGGWLRGLLSAQGVATLGLLPLTVWFFGQASLLGPIANLIAIPWITLGVVPLALFGLLLEAMHGGLGMWAFEAASILMEVLWRPLDLVADWPGVQRWLPEPSPLALLMALFGAFWLLLPRGLPGRPLALLLWLPLLWPSVGRPPEQALDMYQIDVGQGLSVLILTREHALLYDAGPAFSGGLDMGEAAVLPTLRALGVRRLDALVLSHSDNDHAGGAEAIRRAFPTTRVLAPEGSGLAVDGACLTERGWEWDGVRFEFLHPPEHFPYLKNESSCVLRVEAGGRVALLTGDIGATVERRLVRERRESLAADLLTVPHHGSRHSSSVEFVEAVSPSLALVSAAHRGRFGHPHPDVATRYRERGIALESSAEAGLIRVRLDGDGLGAIERWRQRRARLWHEPAR